MSSSLASTWSIRPSQVSQPHGVGSGAAARTTGPENDSYYSPSFTPANWSHSEMQPCVPYSQGSHCSAPSLTVTRPLPLPSYFPQLPSISGDMGSLKCPEGSNFGQIQSGSFAVVASMKNAAFLCCKQLEQVQLNLYKVWVCFWAGDSCSCLFLIKCYPCKWHAHFFLFNCHGWRDLIYSPIQ